MAEKRPQCRLPVMLLLGLLATHAYGITAISIDIGNMESAAGAARKVALQYRLDDKQPALKFSAQIKPVNDQAWSNLSVTCLQFLQSTQLAKLPRQLSQQQWECREGHVLMDHIKAPFSLKVTTETHNGQQQIAMALNLKQASLSDAAGLHAGENVTLQLLTKATQQQNQWMWEVSLDWLAGEVFWQPFYFASAGHSLHANGLMNAQFLSVDDASLVLKDVGKASFKGQLRRSDLSLQTFALDAPALNLETLYPLVLKPLLEKTTLNNLEMEGQASLQLSLNAGMPSAFRLGLKNVDVEDREHRFALYKLNASIPWDYDQLQKVRLAYAGGSLLKVPLGAASLEADLNRHALTSSQLTLPILDGALNLQDISAAWINNEWHWHLRANVVPIDMVGLSQALGLPRMEGKVAASIPMVTYSGGQLGVDGEMGFNLFEGSILVKHLAMQTPLGKVPRLAADLQMRNLDLGALTRTFAFGAIEGKLDGDVNNLQLLNWRPVNFDADFHSSRGRYPKKISQRAVENISALGGAGAAAAIQRSFLRFLKEFNYEKIGLTCKLRNDTCEMGGVESTAQGYIIVKGSGVPSITVMGYNHSVSWGDLLERIARITAGNVTPVIK
jgi:hypothetical protein